MTLIKKTAHLSNVSHFKTLLQQISGMFNATIHPVGIWSHPIAVAKVSQQRIGIYIILIGKVFESLVFLQIAGKPPLELDDFLTFYSDRHKREATSCKNCFAKEHELLFFLHEVCFSHKVCHRITIKLIKCSIFDNFTVNRYKVLVLPKRLLDY